jgi:CheY-like chemotaxis protein
VAPGLVEGDVPHGRTSFKRVLIIEDDPDSAEVLCLTLRAYGHFVEVATSGAEGIKRARTILPDVIISDLDLPDVDGLQVATWVRADEHLRGLWLIAFSGSRVPAVALAAGFDEFVPKPASLAKLAVHLLRDPPPR